MSQLPPRSWVCRSGARLRRFSYRFVSALLALGCAATLSAQRRPILEIPGAYSQQLLGMRMQAAGDVDGDGVSDLLASSWSPNSSSPLPELRILSGKTGSLIRKLSGASYSAFGASFDAGADLDGDGVPDLIVSRQSRMLGYVEIWSGASGKMIRPLFNPLTQRQGFGASVAFIGDVDGDGVEDAAVGNLIGSSYKDRKGAVHIFSGKTGRLLKTIEGYVNRSEFGRVVAGAGDLNGDGKPELVVVSGLALQRGPVFVYSGADWSLLHEIANRADPYRGPAAAQKVADLDGDGRNEILLLAPQDSFKPSQNPRRRGLVRVISGASGKELWALTGLRSQEELGLAMAVLGDIDGDGRPEIAASGNDKSSYKGYVAVFSGRDGRELYRCVDAGPYHYGRQLVGLGDVNGDAVPDLAASWGNYVPKGKSGHSYGLVQVFSGHPDLLKAGTPSLSVSKGGYSLMTMRAGASCASGVFFFVGSASGAAPGFRWGKVQVPIKVDAYTQLLLGASNSLMLPLMGLLDHRGNGTARFVLPRATSPAFIGTQLTHVYVALDRKTLLPILASNPVRIDLVK